MPKSWVSGSTVPVAHQSYWNQIAQLVKQSTTQKPAASLPTVTSRSGMGVKS